MSLEVLEHRQLLSATTFEPTFRDLVQVDVVGRRVFYNNSTFDGDNSAANASDDQAIATDKVALLPGAAPSFANYTSYSRGINGVMVDIAGLPVPTLSASDFEFRVGNTADPSTWSLAPKPTSITVRLGAGTGGSARVEIIWPDNAIQKQWLQVTVKATVSTGLATPDVFYFGNAIGESGNNGANAVVDALDVQGAHNNPRTAANPAPITFAYDYNRDARVDALDETVASSNATTQASSLQFFTAPVPAATPQTQRPPVDLFNWGDAAYPVVFGPALVTTKLGTIIAFAEVRGRNFDNTAYAIVERRSLDGGITWSPITTIYTEGLTGATIGNVAPVVDLITGDISLVFNRNNFDVLATISHDDGVTWDTVRDITPDVKVTAAGNPGPPFLWGDTPWGWYAVGPGHGIQLQNGAHAGRLLIGADHRFTADTSGASWSHVIYSDDHGVTWHLGGGLLPNSDGSPSPNDGSNECSLVETTNGAIYMSSRANGGNSFLRGYSKSTDGGITWTAMQRNAVLSTGKVEASLLRVNANTILLSAPYNFISSDFNLDANRREMSIYASFNNGITWTRLKTIDFGPAGYSDMTLVGPDTILLAYGNGQNAGTVLPGQETSDAIANAAGSQINLVRINLRWLQSTNPYEFSWYFNEKAAGQPATATGTSIQDYGEWNSRAIVVAPPNAPPLYVAGSNGDTALRLTDNIDEVVLQQGGMRSLEFGADDSFTAQVVMRTTADNGVIIGSGPNGTNWSLQVVNGKVQFKLQSLVNGVTTSTTVESTSPINDGNWHRIAAIRDATTAEMSLFVDNVEVPQSPVFRPTHTLFNTDPIVLGAFNNQDLASQLAFDVDTVRITRAALPLAALITASFVNPTPPPAPTYSATSPLSIPGLQFWLPPFDPSRYFGDYRGYSDPLSLNPADGTATRSMIDASPNAYAVSPDALFRAIQYGHDRQVGPYWSFTSGEFNTSELQVNNSSAATGGAKNFDFVQNTGVFTLSTFINVTTDTGLPMTIFDTSEGNAFLPGFNLTRQATGALTLTVAGGPEGPVRFTGVAAGAVLPAGGWYQIAVVGSGPGNPVKFYVTPVSSSTVSVFASGAMFRGGDGVYPTDANHDLFIGSRSNSKGLVGINPFTGSMVNQAIFNTALTDAQIQQLFDFGKSFAVSAWQNPNLPLDVDGNGRVEPRDVLLIINRLAATGSGELPDPTTSNFPPAYFDTTGNWSIEPRDAILVINHILAAAGSATIPVDPHTAVVVEPAATNPAATNQAATIPVASAASVADPTLAAVPSAIASSNRAAASASTATASMSDLFEVDISTAEPEMATAATVVMIEPLFGPTVRTDVEPSSPDESANPLATDAVFRSLGV